VTGSDSAPGDTTDLVLARKLAEALILAAEIRDGAPRYKAPMLVDALTASTMSPPSLTPAGGITSTSWPTSPKPRLGIPSG
jgi:hypothetical protein